MRDYDSDTDYRSDQELAKFRQQQQQMFQRNSDNYSEVVPVAKSHGRRHDGYSSDLEGYSHRVMCAAYREQSAHRDNNSNSSGSHGDRNHSDDSQGHRSYGSNSNSRYPSTSASKPSVAMRSDELYEPNQSVSHYPSSPQPLAPLDQSTPVTPTSTRHSNLGNHGNTQSDWQQDLYQTANQIADLSIIDPQNRYMVGIIEYKLTSSHSCSYTTM